MNDAMIYIGWQPPHLRFQEETDEAILSSSHGWCSISAHTRQLFQRQVELFKMFGQFFEDIPACSSSVKAAKSKLILGNIEMLVNSSHHNC